MIRGVLVTTKPINLGTSPPKPDAPQALARVAAACRSSPGRTPTHRRLDRGGGRSWWRMGRSDWRTTSCVCATDPRRAPEARAGRTVEQARAAGQGRAGQGRGLGREVEGALRGGRAASPEELSELAGKVGRSRRGRRTGQSARQAPAPSGHARPRPVQSAANPHQPGPRAERLPPARPDTVRGRPRTSQAPAVAGRSPSPAPTPRPRRRPVGPARSPGVPPGPRSPG